MTPHRLSNNGEGTVVAKGDGSANCVERRVDDDSILVDQRRKETPSMEGERPPPPPDPTSKEGIGVLGLNAAPPLSVVFDGPPHGDRERVDRNARPESEERSNNPARCGEWCDLGSSLSSPAAVAAAASSHPCPFLREESVERNSCMLEDLLATAMEYDDGRRRAAAVADEADGDDCRDGGHGDYAPSPDGKSEEGASPSSLPPLPSPILRSQIRSYVSAISSRYHHVGFHSFEHASHVMLGATKIVCMLQERSPLHRAPAAAAAAGEAASDDGDSGVMTEPPCGDHREGGVRVVGDEVDGKRDAGRGSGGAKSPSHVGEEEEFGKEGDADLPSIRVREIGKSVQRQQQQLHQQQEQQQRRLQNQHPKENYSCGRSPWRRRRPLPPDVTGTIHDPWLHFAICLSALLHDVDHKGLPNRELLARDDVLATRYSGEARMQSYAEWNSLDVGLGMLRESQEFAELAAVLEGRRLLKDQSAGGGDEMDGEEFYRMVTDLVLCTDIASKERRDMGMQKWERACQAALPPEAWDGDSEGDNGVNVGEVNRPRLDSSEAARAISEQIMQAADVSHTMQRFSTFAKWNACLYRENLAAYLCSPTAAGEEANENVGADHPGKNWYESQIGFFDFYVIPLAERLDGCGAFGEGSPFASLAVKNKERWIKEGRELTRRMVREAEGMELLPPVPITLTSIYKDGLSDECISAQCERKGKSTISENSSEFGDFDVSLLQTKETREEHGGGEASAWASSDLRGLVEATAVEKGVQGTLIKGEVCSCPLERNAEIPELIPSFPNGGVSAERGERPSEALVAQGVDGSDLIIASAAEASPKTDSKVDSEASGMATSFAVGNAADVMVDDTAAPTLSADGSFSDWLHTPEWGLGSMEAMTTTMLAAESKTVDEEDTNSTSRIELGGTSSAAGGGDGEAAPAGVGVPGQSTPPAAGGRASAA